MSETSSTSEPPLPEPALPMFLIAKLSSTEQLLLRIAQPSFGFSLVTSLSVHLLPALPHQIYPVLLDPSRAPRPVFHLSILHFLYLARRNPSIASHISSSFLHL